MLLATSFRGFDNGFIHLFSWRLAFVFKVSSQQFASVLTSCKSCIVLLASKPSVSALRDECFSARKKVRVFEWSESARDLFGGGGGGSSANYQWIHFFTCSVTWLLMQTNRESSEIESTTLPVYELRLRHFVVNNFQRSCYAQNWLLFCILCLIIYQASWYFATAKIDTKNVTGSVPAWNNQTSSACEHVLVFTS